MMRSATGTGALAFPRRKRAKDLTRPSVLTWYRPSYPWMSAHISTLPSSHCGFCTATLFAFFCDRVHSTTKRRFSALIGLSLRIRRRRLQIRPRFAVIALAALGRQARAALGGQFFAPADAQRHGFLCHHRSRRPSVSHPTRRNHAAITDRAALLLGIVLSVGQRERKRACQRVGSVR